MAAVTNGRGVPGRRNRPVQGRSVEKVASILEATRGVMSEAGTELTVREIERRVDFSVGTIYRYFETLDAIVDAVLQEHAEVAEQRVLKLLDENMPATFEDLIVAVTESFIALYREQPNFTQLRVGGDYWSRYVEIEEASNAGLVEQIADVATAAGIFPTGVRHRRRLLVHWTALGAAFRLAFKDNAQGDRIVIAEIRRMAEALAGTYSEPVESATSAS